MMVPMIEIQEVKLKKQRTSKKYYESYISCSSRLKKKREENLTEPLSVVRNLSAHNRTL